MNRNWDIDEINPNVVTHDVDVDGTIVQITDDIREGYGDEKSFGDLTTDVIGEVTGDNDFAIAAGEAARATYDYRADITARNLMAWQRFNGNRPVSKVFPMDTGDAIVVASWWNPKKECYLIGVGLYEDRSGGDYEVKPLSFREVKPDEFF